MDNNNTLKAEKLQTKLDKLLEVKEKKQIAFEKSKNELNAVSKEVDNVKFKLFEILQGGSDDAKFSNWVKRRISENGNFTKGKINNSANIENIGSANPEKSITQDSQPSTAQNQNPRQ